MPCTAPVAASSRSPNHPALLPVTTRLICTRSASAGMSTAIDWRVQPDDRTGPSGCNARVDFADGWSAPSFRFGQMLTTSWAPVPMRGASARMAALSTRR